MTTTLGRSCAICLALLAPGISLYGSEPTARDETGRITIRDLSLADLDSEKHEHVTHSQPQDNEFDHSGPAHSGHYAADHGPLHWQLTESLTQSFEAPAESLRRFSEELFSIERFEFPTELPEDPCGIQETPDRPDLLLEWNEKFLGAGEFGWEGQIATGATWRPAIWIYGEYRSQFATRNDPGALRFTEASHRLNLFGQLNLTGTERLIVGVRPLDEEIRLPSSHLAREFNGYDFHDGDWIDGWNGDFQTLFFEGDFGEVFPLLDLDDSRQIDFGFTIGRQAIVAQQGLLINDDMLDALTVTRNTLSGSGNLNMRISGLFAWNRVSRHSIGTGPVADRNSRMFALLTESDFESTTVNADVVYVESDEIGIGSSIAWGLSAIQRIHGFHNHYNTSLHILGSHPTERETSTSGQGELIFARTSWTPHGGLDLIYVNSFWGIDKFTSPARGPLQGGPMGGSLGILFAHSGIGQYEPPVINEVADAAGGAIGYQLQFDRTRKQVIFEVGGRSDTKSLNDGVIAGGMRYQAACGQHTVWILDGFFAKRESFEISSGVRVEMLLRF